MRDGCLGRRLELRPELSEIACPTLVIIGHHDWVCRPAAGRALATGIPNAHLVELDTGHFGFSETPAPFLAAVRAHLTRSAPSAPTDDRTRLDDRRAA